MTKATSVWFPIGKGPVLQAANQLLDDLRAERQSGGLSGGYRVGAQRGSDKTVKSRRELEIVFNDPNDAVMAKMKFYNP